VFISRLLFLFPQAIKVILSAPGLTLQKVSILCGGPDWPTSVLTGILRLQLSQMLIGSIPIFFLIAPCVLAGGFQNLLVTCEDGTVPVSDGTGGRVLAEAGEEEGSSMFASLATISLLFATLTQTGALLIAMYYIEQVCSPPPTNKDALGVPQPDEYSPRSLLPGPQVASERAEELMAMPKDEEVEEKDAKIREKAKVYYELTDWNRKDFPFWVRVVLVTGALSLSMCCYMAQILGASCFRVSLIIERISCNVLPLVTHAHTHATLTPFRHNWPYRISKYPAILLRLSTRVGSTATF
jgi:hypothetical protein